ncbi:MAG: hypothetical protein QOF03_1956 [Alphaproteobacteria bacterium]|jgi:uncharacterized protein (DUF488 family)|nr:hypothetical protein [Alphaproteobacteria bacterium]
MIFTVGHSNHSLEHFLQLLAGAQIGAIADVRSKPHSRWSPQFNKEALASALGKNGFAYVFLGRELGGRPDDPALLKHGKPDYDAMSRIESFHAGIERIIEGAKTYRIALMCAERDPLDCHRFLLIGRHLASRDIPLAHILASGDVEEHDKTEARFVARNPTGDLFNK